MCDTQGIRLPEVGPIYPVPGPLNTAHYTVKSPKDNLGASPPLYLSEKLNKNRKLAPRGEKIQIIFHSMECSEYYRVRNFTVYSIGGRGGGVSIVFRPSECYLYHYKMLIKDADT